MLSVSENSKSDTYTFDNKFYTYNNQNILMF